MEPARIDPGASIGAVHLTVSDLERCAVFYRDALGFATLEREDRMARMGAGGTELLRLTEVPGARRPARATGLYHAAYLVPNRLELAHALSRLQAAGARLRGFADHGVSEALYLSDPEGNGIEIYRDRPRDAWPRDERGGYRLISEPLDLDALMREAHGAARDALAPAGTRVGHVHLHVSRLDEAERFYVDTLGFEVMARWGHEALFIAAGAYHHHVGLNTWAGVGIPTPPPESAGLRWFEIRHRSEEERERTLSRLRRAQLDGEQDEGGIVVRDPSGNGVRLPKARSEVGAGSSPASGSNAAA